MNHGTRPSPLVIFWYFAGLAITTVLVIAWIASSAPASVRDGDPGGDSNPCSIYDIGCDPNVNDPPSYDPNPDYNPWPSNEPYPPFDDTDLRPDQTIPDDWFHPEPYQP